MSWDLHPEEMIDKASSLPVTQTPEVGVFHNFMEGAAKVAMQGFAKTARAVDLLGAVGPIVEDWATDVQNRRALGSVPATMPKTVTAQDRYFKEHDAMFQSAVDYWTPRPNEVGVAGEVAGSLLNMLPTIMASPALAVGATQLAQGQDLVQQGVDPGKAQAVGAVQALGLGAGIWMPILGTNALQRIVIGGAGFNVVQGVATRAASKAILDGDKAAEQFRPLGGTELTLDILLGLAFGGMAHINPAQRAQGAKAWEDIGNFLKDAPPSDKAALATLREAQHINLDSLPGTPQTAADLDVHVQRMRAAIESLATDKPVDVENIVKEPLPIRPGDPRSVFAAAETPRPSEMGAGQEATARDEKYDVDIKLSKDEKGYTITETDASGTRSGEITHGMGGIYFKDLILNMEGEFIPAKEVRQAGTGEPDPAATPFKPDASNRQAVLDLVAEMEFERARGNSARVDELAAILADVASGKVSAGDALARSAPAAPAAPDANPRYNPDMARIEQDTAIREAIQEHAKTVAAEEGIPQIPDRKTIAQTIEEQLVQAGRPAEEAKAGATLWQAFFDTTASRYGRTGQELFDRYMKGITGQAGEGPMETQALFQPAYHASPHTFDEFKLQHIGSGEGAQVYGWGLYFATNTRVRDWYYENFMAKAKNEAQTTIADQAGVDSLLAARKDIDPAMAAEYMAARQAGKTPVQATQEVGRAHGLHKQTSNTQIDWIEQSMEIERAGLHKITAGDEPAYKTPTGEIVHTRMGGEAKAKADAIGQLLNQGYAEAAKTYDNLIIDAKDWATISNHKISQHAQRLEYELNQEWAARPLGQDRFEVSINGVEHVNKIAATRAEAIDMAQQVMRDKLSRTAIDIQKNNERVTELERARALLDEYTRPAQAGLRSVLPSIEEIKPEIKKPRKYEVELAPDESEYLPWETTLADMPKAIQDKLDGTIDPHYFDEPNLYTGKDIYKSLVRTAKDIKNGNEDDGYFGLENAGISDYSNMSPEEMASRVLNNSGIPGIKYMDGFTRKRGHGTYNIVLFDDSKVTIKHMEQAGNRGYMNMGQDGKMAIGILKSADASTFLHESGHFFLEVTNDLASQPDAPAGMKQDMQTLYSWFGLKDADTWNNMTLDEKRPYHEQFARGFERYLRDGQAPTPVLKGLFQRFRDWLKAVYQSASQLNVEVSDQVRAVMDRMLAEPQRTEAPPEATRPATPPPPRGGVGEPMGEASVPEGTVKPFEPKTSDDPQILEMLRDMATNEAGWAQVGGKWMGKAEKGSGVPNFTTWIPKTEWWNDRPDKKMNEAKFVEAVTKHMTDEKMTPAEKRAVDFLTDIANKRLEAKQLYDDAEWNRIAQEVATEGMDPTTKNVVDADAVSIAMQIDEARVERAAITAADDHDFMAEVREIIDGYKPQPDATAAERSAPPAAKPGTTSPAGQEANAPGADRNAGNQGVIAQQALRMVAENPDLPIATGVDAQGNTTYQKASEYLAEAKAMADLRRQDVSLFELAAQCLLGGGR